MKNHNKFMSKIPYFVGILMILTCSFSHANDVIYKRFIGNWHGTFGAKFNCQGVTYWETYRAPDGLFISRIFSDLTDNKKPVDIFYGRWWIKNGDYYDTVDEIKFGDEVYFNAKDFGEKSDTQNIEHFKFEGLNTIHFTHFVRTPDDGCPGQEAYETIEHRVISK